MTRGSRHKLPLGKFQLAIRKHVFHHGQTLEQVAQRGCGISVFGDFQNLILKHNLIEPAEEHVSGLDQKTSTGPLHPKLSYDGYFYSILKSQPELNY